eukprot:gene1893-biopygen11163
MISLYTTVTFQRRCAVFHQICDRYAIALLKNGFKICGVHCCVALGQTLGCHPCHANIIILRIAIINLVFFLFPFLLSRILSRANSLTNGDPLGICIVEYLPMRTKPQHREALYDPRADPVSATEDDLGTVRMRAKKGVSMLFHDP